MDKIQKILRLIRRELAFSILLFATIVILFIVLSPKVSSILFSFKRDAILNDFINKTKTAGEIDAQSYWKFREFYSPGYFIFSRDGIKGEPLKNAQKKIGIDYNIENIDLIALLFSSKKLGSLDMLTRQSSLSALFDRKQIPKENIIFMGKKSVIYKEEPNYVKIIFLLNNKDMRRAIGFFDYKDKDRELTEGENWLNVTSLTTD